MNIQVLALFLAPATALTALIYGFILSRRIMKEEVTNQKLLDIAKAV